MQTNKEVLDKADNLLAHVERSLAITSLCIVLVKIGYQFGKQDTERAWTGQNAPGPESHMGD